MRVRIRKLVITTRRTEEILEFSPTVTFIYGPVGTGKSTVARMIDYCLGGRLERTPAVKREFVAATMEVDVGNYTCHLERGATDTQSVRVSWTDGKGRVESLNAPIPAGDVSLVGSEVYNLSDLLFFLCGVTPIKVRRRHTDPDSPLIRLSFRDVWWYCYLDQLELDSSFFHLDEPFKGRKSQDAMRFFTGLHSERLSQLEEVLYRAINEQKGKREAVGQIRDLMKRFDLASDSECGNRISENERQLQEAEGRRTELEERRVVELHPTDRLRDRLRALGGRIDETQMSISDIEEAVAEQRALRAELITAKIKADRTKQAEGLLRGVCYTRCPECGADNEGRIVDPDQCSLCLTRVDLSGRTTEAEGETVRRDLNERIDQLADSIRRRESAREKEVRELARLRGDKRQFDRRLQREVARYDSAFVDSIRELEGRIATLVERKRFLEKLQKMREVIDVLENEAGVLQGKIDNLRSQRAEEASRLGEADRKVASIASHFKSIMRNVGFPGVEEGDNVVVDSRTWRPTIEHKGHKWNFWDAGSGGKKTLFNVCYALAVHAAGIEHGMPLPNILVIDSPTKNISEDENPELVDALYREIYRYARAETGEGTQFLLIDSDLVAPTEDAPGFQHRHMAGRSDAPSLFPYYKGP